MGYVHDRAAGFPLIQFDVDREAGRQALQAKLRRRKQRQARAKKHLQQRNR